MINERFGSLVVLGVADHNLRGTRDHTYACVCDCGRFTFATDKALSEGSRDRCGASHGEVLVVDEWGNHVVRKKNRLGVYKAQAAARVATKRLIAAGAIVRLRECEVCGSTDRVGAHHEDYDRPEFVVFLCQSHHAARHVRLRDQGRDPSDLLMARLEREYRAALSEQAA